MTDATVGRVERLARYPVKSLQGEVLESVACGERGLDGDRRLGVVDAESGLVLSAKRTAALLGGRARTTPDGVQVLLGDGGWVAAPSSSLDAAVSEWLGRPVTVEAPPPEDARSFAMSMNVDDERDEVFEWPCPSGTYFDFAAVHLLTTSSLRAATGLHPAGRWEVDRFRPNVLVETAGDGFVEDAWVGGRLRLGGVELELLLPTVRCVMTTRPQRDLPRDLEIVKAMNRHHDGNLGVYCSVVTPGVVRLGDDVSFSRQ